MVRLLTEVAELRHQMQTQAGLLDKVQSGMRSNVGHLARIGQLLGRLAEDTAERFDELESRIDHLERRAAGK